MILGNSLSASTGRRPVIGLHAPARTRSASIRVQTLDGHLGVVSLEPIERGYGHTHHSQSDTYDMAVASDLVQASAVMAVSAYELANLPGLIPRGERSAPTPVEAVKVSDSLIVKGRGAN